MQHTPFRHPLASHAAGTVLGYRRNGSPIYAIAGGNGAGEGGSGTGAPAGDGGTGGTGTGQGAGGQTGQQGTQSGTGGTGDTTDWKAMARQWEDRAKANKTAAEELAALKASNQTEQEKAVADAEKAGRTAAATEYGAKLAAAEFRAAVAKAGIDLGEASDLIDTTRFVTADGDADTAAIKAAVDKLAKLAPKGPGRSGGDMSGGNGGGPTLAAQIADAQKRRDFATVIRLKRQQAATTQ
jgi:hypothetical protein